MSNLETFLWVAFPWLAIAAFVVGMIWRWRTDQFGWTTHSSQIYESKLLRLSSPLFHYGMLFVIIGHLMGLAIPKSWTRGVGISDEVYHLIATIPGTIAGVAVILGLLGLLYRRIINRSVYLSTSASDKWMFVFLGFAILTGFVATVATQVFGGPHGYDYRETISPWIRQLLILNAEPQLMADVPWQFKLHVISGFTLMAVWPFTRLVHAFSAPVGYVSRPYVVYRSRDSHNPAGHAPAGWEPIRSRTQQLQDREAPSRGA
ncbi:respiratory nitrate reductase subunit gamma [Corynebacterium tapiri]|uniref:Nitrate reductase-like protein NarX n=1 Tax=Corynebacterium tapiri TaxID=1448266 RepID=A0A5C4U5F5_9CORY|nr:respiratory nitrate reductase subunit gamma [Corynebacterium tapiri]TNL99720.1 respiratory nitrate reductase subunit gamma [Corynebacterium tapiri]